jgi:ABC-type sulfate transport system substrate-binding protein
MILADIQTSNPDRHGQNWGVLIKDNVAQLAPNFDYDYTFSQNEYAMKGIAEAVENKDNNITNKIMQKYNVKKFTGFLKNTIDHIGLQIGQGNRFFVDMDTQKYSFKETARYIKKELGEKEYQEIIGRVDIQKALPQPNNKDNEIYSLLAQLHSASVRNRITEIDEMEY